MDNILDPKNKIGGYKPIDCNEAKRIIDLIKNGNKDQVTPDELAAVMLHVAECDTCEVPTSSTDSVE